MDSYDSENDILRNKYLEYKDKYNKLKKYYDLLIAKHNKAVDVNRTDEYCHITGKKFEDNDLISRCDGCKHWGLVSEVIKMDNCRYCNSNLDSKVSLKDEEIMEMIDLIEDDREDMTDISLKNLKFSYGDKDNDERVREYNKRLLGNDKVFDKSYNNYIESHDRGLQKLLLDNIHILVDGSVPDNFMGTYNYHMLNHNDEMDKENCLYCMYNKII